MSKKSIALIFSYSPHGNSYGRETLDLILSISVCTKISLFFLDDGVFQLFVNQNPKYILSKNYTNAFKILSSLYKINNFYCCLDSLKERGLNENVNYLINVIFLNNFFLKKKIKFHDYILKF